MTETAATAAMSACLQELRANLVRLGADLDVALDDLGGGNRLAAVGALASADDAIEQMGAMLASVRAINRAAVGR